MGLNWETFISFISFISTTWFKNFGTESLNNYLKIICTSWILKCRIKKLLIYNNVFKYIIFFCSEQKYCDIIFVLSGSLHVYNNNDIDKKDKYPSP